MSDLIEVVIAAALDEWESDSGMAIDMTAAAWIAHRLREHGLLAEGYEQIGWTNKNNKRQLWNLGSNGTVPPWFRPVFVRRETE